MTSVGVQTAKIHFFPLLDFKFIYKRIVMAIRMVKIRQQTQNLLTLQ